jgi:hypothetical protein
MSDARLLLFAMLHFWTPFQVLAQGSGDIRLVGGSTTSEGRVEIYYSGEWGTVCHNLWSFNDAQVVCRQLGYSGTIRSRTAAYYGQGSGKIWMDRVTCSGSESRLSSCSFSGWGVYSSTCDHGDDAGVACKCMTVCCKRESDYNEPTPKVNIYTRKKLLNS